MGHPFLTLTNTILNNESNIKLICYECLSKCIETNTAIYTKPTTDKLLQLLEINVVQSINGLTIFLKNTKKKKNKVSVTK